MSHERTNRARRLVAALNQEYKLKLKHTDGIKLIALVDGHRNEHVAAAHERTMEPTNAGKHWSSGYFCAVSVLLREEGCVTEAVRGLFKQGGDAALADPEDIELFRLHGLLV